MGTSSLAGDRARSSDHHLCCQGPSVEASLQQQELMPCATSSSTALDHDTMALLLERGHAFHRKDKCFHVKEERIVSDGIDDNVAIRSRLKFNVDVALRSGVSGVRLGTECVLDPLYAAQPGAVMQTDAGTMSRLGMSLGREHLKQVAKDRQCAGLPTRAHDGWHPLPQSNVVDPGFVLLVCIALKLGALDDGFAMLKYLVRNRPDELRRQAEQSRIHPFDFAPMSKHGLAGPVRRKGPQYAFWTPHDACKLDVVACEDSFHAGPT
jgi:hypothetical protein